MSQKKSAKIFYADLWGLRSEKYKFLLENDVKTTKWQELKPTTPYYFFVPKDFALQSEYDKFWKVTEIFKEWSFGITTSRDHFVVGFSKEEIVQRLRVFTGNLSDELVKEGLHLKDTRTWKLSEARQKVKGELLEEEIYPYAYRPFDNRWIWYESSVIERDRRDIMQHILNRKNLGLNLTRKLRDPFWRHAYPSFLVTDKTILSSRDNCYFFPLYLYPDEPVGAIHVEHPARGGELPLQHDIPKTKSERIPNFTDKFLQAIKESLGSEPTPQEIFYYIYAVLYSPTYRKRYEEFLKIDFPQVPLPSNNEAFKELNSLGKELVELHLLKHSSLTDSEVGFPKSGSNMMEKVVYDEQNQIVFINKEQYFEGISKEVWKYQIGAYQVMEKYLKDRKSRKLSLDEIDHYMKMAKAIRLTIVLQEKIDEVYRKIEI
jgi:predicted helicase